MDMSFLDLFRLLIKKIKIIIAVALLAAILMFSYCIFLMTPVYSAEASILIASGVLFKNEDTFTNTDYITTGELSTSFALMKSFSGILTRSIDYYDVALTSVQDELNNKYTVAEFIGMTDISYEENSIILTIRVKASDPNDAVVLVKALANSAPKEITNRLGRTSATILDVDTSAVKVGPKTFTLTAAALFFGFALSSIVIVFVRYQDKTVKGEDDFLNNHDIPLLGAVPDFENEIKSKRKVRNNG